MSPPDPKLGRITGGRSHAVVTGVTHDVVGLLLYFPAGPAQLGWSATASGSARNAGRGSATACGLLPTPL